MLRKQKWNSNSIQFIMEFELQRHLLSLRCWQDQGQSAEDDSDQDVLFHFSEAVYGAAGTASAALA